MGVLDAPAKPPSSRGAPTVLLGDSIQHGNSTTDNGAPVSGVLPASLDPYVGGNCGGQGFGEVLCVMSKGRLRRVANAGVPGETSTQILARLPMVLALKPKFVILMATTNDHGQAITTATSQANVLAMIRGCKARGVGLVLSSIPPRSDDTIPAGTTVGYRQWIAETNAWLARMAAGEGVDFVNHTPALMDPATAFYKAGLSPDGVHPYNAPSMRMIAANILAALEGRLAPSQPYWSGSDFDVDNLLNVGASGTSRNALFRNSAGGTIPDGWTVTSAGDGTVTNTLVVPAAPDWVGKALKFTATGGAPVRQVSRTVTIASGEIATGDILAVYHRVSAQAELSSGAGVNNLLYGSALNLKDSGSSVIATANVMYSYKCNIDDGIAYQEIRAPAGVASAVMSFATSGGTGQVMFAQPMLVNLTQLGLAGL